MGLIDWHTHLWSLDYHLTERAEMQLNRIGEMDLDATSDRYLKEVGSQTEGSVLVGSYWPIAAPPRFCQRSTRSQSNWTPVATPPSKKANESAGNLWLTPPKKSAFANASPAAPKFPMWLYM